MKKVVVIGGGTGLSTLLRGLRDYPIDITAIVTMTDDGASSGKLRKNHGILPPGDIRKCIAALSHDESGLTELFEYRYRDGLALRGHSVGNLLITALKEMTGSFELAIEKISDILKIKGCVLPATLEDVHLVALFDNGVIQTGEVKIRKYGYKHKIKKLSLSQKASTNPRALKAIDEADVIIAGPGSLFTSVIPNFLQKKLVKAVANSCALKAYVSNISTERGETEGFSLEDHCRLLDSYGFAPDIVIVNNGLSSAKPGDNYVEMIKEDGSYKKIGYKRYADIISDTNPLYHDPMKLGKECYKIIISSEKIKKGVARGLFT